MSKTGIGDMKSVILKGCERKFHWNENGEKKCKNET
jgi:hypothetical protein